MLVSTQHKFVLLSNTKCGSTSLVHSLADHVQGVFHTDHRLRHTNFRVYRSKFLPFLREQIGDEADDLEVLCLMREPLDWLTSWYRFRARAELADPGHPRHGEYTGGMSWADFLEGYIGIPFEKRPPWAKVGTQADFIVGEHDRAEGITLFRYEDFAALVDYLQHKVGAKLDILEWNVSPKMDVEPTGKDHLDLLSIIFHKDYDIYRRIKPGGTRF